jgi:hypothetical protein
MLILRLDKAGQPKSWCSREDAATLYAKNQVIWELGDTKEKMMGGYNSTGLQSSLSLSPIIACEGKIKGEIGAISLTNPLLFRRDRNMCMYCGNNFSPNVLTRDHVIPRAQNGPDRWNNVVASCTRCNSFKGARTPEQAGMKLLAVPFKPNLYEHFYLRNKKILCDQIDFLKTKFSKNLKL